MKFNIGDKVSFLNEKGSGIIAKILNKNTLLIRIEEGLEIPFHTDGLVLAHGEPFMKLNESGSRSAGFHKDQPGGKSHNKVKKAGETKEVDLHIEELEDDLKGLTNGEKLRIQITRFQKELDNAIARKMNKIVFIHGVGSGRLKQEIYTILKIYEGIDFYDASYKKYGFGATEVVIR